MAATQQFTESVALDDRVQPIRVLLAREGHKIQRMTYLLKRLCRGPQFRVLESSVTIDRLGKNWDW